jgi:hypothetical protein
MSAASATNSGGPSTRTAWFRSPALTFRASRASASAGSLTQRRSSHHSRAATATAPNALTTTATNSRSVRQRSERTASARLLRSCALYASKLVRIWLNSTCPRSASAGGSAPVALIVAIAGNAHSWYQRSAAALNASRLAWDAGSLPSSARMRSVGFCAWVVSASLIGWSELRFFVSAYPRTAVSMSSQLTNLRLDMPCAAK